MEQVSDDDLIRMYRNGDAEAFDTLFDRGPDKAAGGVTSIEEVLRVVPLGNAV